MSKTKLKWKSIIFKQIALVFFTISFFVLYSSCKGSVNTHENTENELEKQYSVQGVDFKMILIEGANATLGSETQSDNKEHTIKLDSYWIGETEVTQELWNAIMPKNLSYFDGSDEEKAPSEGEIQLRRPVEWITWFEAVAFCNELTKKINGGDDGECVYTLEGRCYTLDDAKEDKRPITNMGKKGFRLPTEAEWEWAAKGGANDSWAGCNDEEVLKDYAWFRDNSEGYTHEVKKKKPNAYGLYDMNGNVFEWCGDWWGDITSEMPDNYTGPSSGIARVIRGGAYETKATEMLTYYRAGLRYDIPALQFLGLRLACRAETQNIKPDLPLTPTIETKEHKVGSITFKTIGIASTNAATLGDESVEGNPIHTIGLSSYAIGETEVTQELWQEIMQENPSHFVGTEKEKKVAEGEEQNRRPVENINWYLAIAFCNELTKRVSSEAECVYTTGGHIYTKEDASNKKEPIMDMSKKGFRLPTEAEWEWAAKGGNTQHIWAGCNDGETVKNYSWFNQNSNYRTHEIKKKEANGYGLYDMSGNVFEMCWDWDGDINVDMQNNYAGPTTGEYRVVRGGSCAYSKDHSKVAYRMRSLPTDSILDLGIRVVCKL